MPDEKNNLYLFEAIELRAEVDSLRKRRRKLNTAVQRANHETVVAYKDEPANRRSHSAE